MGTRKRHYEEGWPFGRPVVLRGGRPVVLRGEDAVRFMKEISDPKPASEEEVRRCREAYEWAKSIATFPLP